MTQDLIFTTSPAEALKEQIERMLPASIFTLCDSNTATMCRPLIQQAFSNGRHATHITIAPGDDNKNLKALEHVWRMLSDNGATRKSLLINIGGGMVTDLGGFAASTFKRGIRFINMPTSLLGAVDAAVGGKTGINFNGLKNEIGAFRMADAVIISPAFYTTLPRTELISGYGETLKHALLDSPPALAEAIDFDPDTASPLTLGPILEKSIMVKQRIVQADPYEQGCRKALNLGHTAAHAFESLAMLHRQPLPHGIAVAHGLVLDLVLSRMLLNFPSDTLYNVAAFVKHHYPAPQFSCNDYKRIMEFMRHDKKNVTSGHINFTLLEKPGSFKTDCIVEATDIMTGLDITRDLLGV